MPHDYTNLPDEEFADLAAAVAAESRRRQVKAHAAAEAERVAAQYAEAVAAEPAATWAVGTVVGPG
ncbi:MAG: hypothetical protein Q4F67_15245, partial [Propionibacteriaceae bacterium]|nr:hypothetical protein [Propionibacteriaceae bacterium]